MAVNKLFWKFEFNFSVYHADGRTPIENSIIITDRQTNPFFIVSGGNVTQCRSLLERNSGRDVSIWNSGVVITNTLYLPPWLDSREIDKYQRDKRYTMTGNTFIPFTLSTRENGYFDYVADEIHGDDNPFYWTIYSEIYDGVETGIKTFSPSYPKIGSVNVRQFPISTTHNFIDTNNCSISNVNYVYSGHDGNIVVTGNTGNNTYVSGIPGTISYFKASRNGFKPSIKTTRLYEATQTSSNIFALYNSFNHILSGDGEVASNLRLEETFPDIIPNIAQSLGNYKNYSRVQQPPELSNQPFVYSTIATNQDILTLRIEDYLRTNPYNPGDDFPENPPITGYITTSYWSGEVTSIKTYTPSTDYNNYTSIEDFSNLAGSFDQNSSEWFSNARVYSGNMSLTGNVATFSAPNATTIMIASPIINCYLSGITYSKFHSITVLSGSAIYTLFDNTTNTSIVSETFELTYVAPYYTDTTTTISTSSGVAYTNQTLTDASLTATGTSSTHNYSLQIELNADISYILCEPCWKTHAYNTDLKLSGSSSIWAEMQSQTISYCGF